MPFTTSLSVPSPLKSKTFGGLPSNAWNGSGIGMALQATAASRAPDNRQAILSFHGMTKRFGGTRAGREEQRYAHRWQRATVQKRHAPDSSLYSLQFRVGGDPVTYDALFQVR